MAYEWIALVVMIIINILVYVLSPKPKQQKPLAAQDLEEPTADAGRPVPKVWGTLTVKSINVLWFGEKNVREYKIRA